MKARRNEAEPPKRRIEGSKNLDFGFNFVRGICIYFKDYCFMAKKATTLIRLVSSAGTGFFYVKKKNSRTSTEKLKLKKYDARARKHVEFVEQKIK